MPKLTDEQRLNCMRVAAKYIDQPAYIQNYSGSILNVIVLDKDNFPSLYSMRDSMDSPAFKAELLRLFGFNRFSNPDWLLFIRAKNDIEKIGRGRIYVSDAMIDRPITPKVTPKVTLIDRLKSAFSFGMDP